MGLFGEAAETETAGRALERYALDALAWHWGEAYEITVTGSVWRAWRLDKIGGPIEAGSPEELRQLILDDYVARPVPRDVARRPPGE